MPFTDEFHQKKREDYARRFAEDPEYFRAKGRRGAKKFYKNVKGTPARIASNRKYFLKREYGISPEEYDALFLAQGSCCAACKRVDPCDKRGWHIDHDHHKKKGDKGFIRGILCGPCNKAASKWMTSFALHQLAFYMDKHDAAYPSQ